MMYIPGHIVVKSGTRLMNRKSSTNLRNTRQNPTYISLLTTVVAVFLTVALASAELHGNEKKTKKNFLIKMSLEEITAVKPTKLGGQGKDLVGDQEPVFKGEALSKSR